MEAVFHTHLHHYTKLCSQRDSTVTSWLISWSRYCEVPTLRPQKTGYRQNNKIETTMSFHFSWPISFIPVFFLSHWLPTSKLFIKTILSLAFVNEFLLFQNFAYSLLWNSCKINICQHYSPCCSHHIKRSVTCVERIRKHLCVRHENKTRTRAHFHSIKCSETATTTTLDLISKYI